MTKSKIERHLDCNESIALIQAYANNILEQKYGLHDKDSARDLLEMALKIARICNQWRRINKAEMEASRASGYANLIKGRL